MSSPTQWPSLSSTLYDYADSVWPGNNNGTSQARSFPRQLDLSQRPSSLHARQPGSGSKVNYALQAITCAVAMDSGKTTTMDVFNEVIYTTMTETQMFQGTPAFWLSP